jgi:predicted enzyme related to lactoylglutathione lyase
VARSGDCRQASWLVKVPPLSPGPVLLGRFLREAKTVKNRWHLDVWVGAENVPAVMEQLTGQGARFLHEATQGPHRWVTMADPEGNEFCIS